MLVGVLAGVSPASGTCPVANVVIFGGGAGDQSVENPDVESQYGMNDGGVERELRMGGPIWEKDGQWNDQSPIRYSGAFRTPTPVTQGEHDYRVPINESMTTFKILQRRGVPSRLVVFPDEGHWILKGENSRIHMQEVLAWLQKYL